MSLQVEYPDRDPAFRPSASGSGLLVPADISRDREVWTNDEIRLIDRATNLMKSRGLAVHFACTHDRCKDTRGAITRHLNPDGTFTLQCEHKDRIVQRAF